jgi:hypothetical protein
MDSSLLAADGWLAPSVDSAESYILPPEQHVLGGHTTWPERTAGLEVDAELKTVETLLSAQSPTEAI